jgi:hypothetical protein
MGTFKERCGFGSIESLKITIQKEESKETPKESKESKELKEPKEIKALKPKKEKVKEEIVNSSKEITDSPKEITDSPKEETETPKESKESKILNPKKEKKKAPILPTLSIDPNHTGLKQEHYKVLNEELKGFLFKTDKLNEIYTAVCIGKLPIKMIESIPEDYEYSLEELSEKDLEILNKFERPYKFEGKKKEEDPMWCDYCNP